MLEASDNEDGPFSSQEERISQGKSEVSESNSSFPLNKETKALLQIFSYLNVLDLNRVARVCKTWKRLTGQDSLWKKFLPKSVQEISPNGITWKKLYLNRRREFLLSCKQNPGVYIRLDNDTYVAGRGGDISGEVIINLAEDDKLLSPVSIRVLGYEESYDNHAVFLDEGLELEVGGFSRRNKWDRDVFPIAAERGLHGFPFSISIPRVDSTGGPLPPSISYVWKENIIDNDTFALEYLLVAKAQFFQLGGLKKSRKLTMLPSFDPVEKYSKVRFSNSENVYSSRFPFANVTLRAGLQDHPTISEDGNIHFQISVEVDNFNTNVSGPAEVTLYHTAVSEEYVPPELHAPRLTKEFPLQIPKSSYRAAPYKVKLEIAIPQREFLVEKIRGPPPAWAYCVHSFLVSLKVSLFTTVSVNIPIEFMKKGSEANTEKEQDLSRPVVELE